MTTNATESDILERAKAKLAAGYTAINESVVRELITEVERLRSADAHHIDKWKETLEILAVANGNRRLKDREIQTLRTEITAKDARINELEAAVVDGRAQYLLFLRDNPNCIAWNFDELDEIDQDTLRDQAKISLEMEEPWALIQLREARERVKELSDLNESLMKNGNDLRSRCQKTEADNLMLSMWNRRYMARIERLEAAFLKIYACGRWSEYMLDWISYPDGGIPEWEENARAALEELKR